ncbi:MAG: DUF5103 domain-containing protein [Cyclobacteriaceae bacterium]|nr:DUF5103 domain-containing protein [Cyclobacteriaceae bacterium]
MYEDKVYNQDIKTVQLYVNKGYPGAMIEPAVINVRERFQLILEFDELYKDARYFQARILHCNWDWTPSQLISIEYLDQYNEFEISDYEYSVNTKVPYTHYTFQVPRVTLPGNYLLIVYGRDDPDDLILSNRFVVYDQLVKVSPWMERSTGIQERRTHQQIEFTISYAGLEVFNPQTEIKVVFRKNQSWVSAIFDLKPTMVREIDNFLEYRHFNLENNFYGGNEYRFFDLNSVQAPGRNVDRVMMKDDRIDAFLYMDKSRGGDFYGAWDDLNGGYIIADIDGIDPAVEAEYAYVHFFLQLEEPLQSEVYVYGKLSHYNLLPAFKMKYDRELGGYLANLQLKQGWYDYVYYTPGNPWVVEGSHFETRNEYEILVYYRPQGKISEYVIGYVNFTSKR